MKTVFAVLALLALAGVASAEKYMYMSNQPGSGDDLSDPKSVDYYGTVEVTDKGMGNWHLMFEGKGGKKFEKDGDHLGEAFMIEMDKDGKRYFAGGWGAEKRQDVENGIWGGLVGKMESNDLIEGEWNVMNMADKGQGVIKMVKGDMMNKMMKEMGMADAA